MAVEKRWQRILASALDGVVVEPAEVSARPDLTIRTRDGHSIAVEVKWAGEGWPDDCSSRGGQRAGALAG